MTQGSVRQLLACALTAGLGFAAAPLANATLLWAITAGGIPACAVDQDAFACGHGLQVPDFDDRPGFIEIDALLGDFLIEESRLVSFTGFQPASDTEPEPLLLVYLLASNTTRYTNLGPTPIAVNIAVSDTGYIGNGAAMAAVLGSGDWTNTTGSSMSMEWYIDPANTQGATTPGHRPGALLDSFTDFVTLPCACFDHQGGPVEASISGPFSMTLGLDLTLTPEGALDNARQGDFALFAVPEPATVALVGLALAALGTTRRYARMKTHKERG